MGNYIEKANINYGEVDFEGNRIRTVEDDGQLHFCLSDCLKAVGTTTRTNQIKWDNEMAITKLYPCRDVLGRQQLTKFVTEAGLYELLEKVNLDKNDKEKSEKVLRFRHKLNNDILPSIRKHGSYVDKERVEDSNYEFVQKLMNAPRSELFRMLAEAEDEKERQEKMLEVQRETIRKMGDGLHEQTAMSIRLQGELMRQKAVVDRWAPVGECPDGYYMRRGSYCRKPKRRKVDVAEARQLLLGIPQKDVSAEE